MIEYLKTSDITYRVELSFGGYLGATCELEVDAPANISEEDLMEIIRTEYDYELYDMLDMDSMERIEDDEWQVTFSLDGYSGCTMDYTVYADYEEEAEELAQEEALWDFTIDYFEPVE